MSWIVHEQDEEIPRVALDVEKGEAELANVLRTITRRETGSTMANGFASATSNRPEAARSPRGNRRKDFESPPAQAPGRVAIAAGPRA